LTASATVTNTGRVAADEVVQLYVRLKGTSVAEPVHKLEGFQRVSLAPGEQKKVSFSLTAETFAIWDMRNNFTVEPSLVELWISPNSATGESVPLEITE